MGKFDYKGFGTVMILSLVLVTILSWMLSQYTNIPTLKSGPAFILLFIATFLVYLYIAASDAKISKGEILTIFMVAISLIVSGVVLKKFMPEIFSAMPQVTQEFFNVFPQTTKELFSVLG